jgi:hypothetical protein
MLPRLVLRMRKALKRLPLEPVAPDPAVEGPAIRAQWEHMLANANAPVRETERRLKRAEDALNRLRLS